jgi:Xaa-Pro aminopeptidase
MLLNKARAVEVMERHGLDGLVATNRHNIYYLSDFWGYEMRGERTFTNYAVLPRGDDKPAAIVLQMTEYAASLSNPPWVPNVIGFSGRVSPTATNIGGRDELADNPLSVHTMAEGADLTPYEKELVATAPSRIVGTPDEALKRALEDAGLGAGVIGADDPRIIGWMNSLGLEGLTGVDATNIFREIRMVKSDAEVALLRRAGELNERAAEAAMAAMHEGATCDELIAVYNLEMTRGGGHGIYILIGGTTGLRHGHMVKGEPTMLDALGTYAHYHADLGRTVVLGEPDEKITVRDRAMQAGWRAACDALKPGVRAADVVAHVMDVIHREGFPAFNHAVAHTLGLEHTDHPLPLSPALTGEGSDFVLEPNMVFNFDMPYQEYGWGSMHIEDTMCVTSDGFEALTSGRTGLRVLG